MNLNLRRRKNLIRWTLAVVLAVDAALLVVNLQPGPTFQMQKREEERLQRQHDLLGADVRRAAAIRQRLPEVRRECDQFFTEELREASTGYSSVIADLGAIAKQAGLRTSGIGFHQKDVGNRGVVEVEVSTAVEGDYPSLVSFINGLERSKNFYLLDSLDLASRTEGNLKLNLRLRTYFRS